MRYFLIALCLLAGQALAQPSMRAQDWDILHSVAMPAHPTQHSSGGWFFNFPQYPTENLPCANDQACASVHYVTVPLGSLAGRRALVLTGRVETPTGNPVFHYQTEPFNTAANGCGAPAALRLYFQRRGDNLSGNGPYEHFRWWSNPGNVQMARGNFRLVVALVPSQWSNVRGHKGSLSAATINGFRAALSQVSSAGFTGGGGCSFGHGLNIDNGTARLVVTGFRFQ